MPLRQGGLLGVVHAPLCMTFAAAAIAPWYFVTVEGGSSRWRLQRFERKGDPVLVHRTMATKFGVQLV
eukprot:2397716-Pleurochrysis_carterae.AAC.1